MELFSHRRHFCPGRMRISKEFVSICEQVLGPQVVHGFKAHRRNYV